MHKLSTNIKRLWLMAGASLVLLGTASMAVVQASQTSGASNGQQEFQAVLTPLNGTNAYGEVTGTVWKNNWARFQISAQNLINAPHAQHVHFGVTAAHECPALSADKDGDKIVSTTEGGPDYGPVQTSLTTKGDTSPASTLAVDRFPTYAKGATYDRTFQLTSEQAQQIRSGLSVVVVHGIDTIQKDGKYDGDAKSDLDESLPQEATAPASCGPLHEVTSSVDSKSTKQ